VTAAFLILFIQAIFIYRLVFLLYPPFQSDESVYSYAALALTKGLTPYRDIALYQPPLQYWLMSSVISISGPSLVALRLTVAAVQTMCVVFVYLVARSYFKRFQTSRVDLLALATSIIFACYSTLMFQWFGLNESLYTLFALASLTLFLNACSRRSPLILCGIFLGLSVLTKYYGLLFGLSLCVLVFLDEKRSKGFEFVRTGFSNLLWIVVGASMVLFPFFLLLTFAWNGLQNFLTQTVFWYTSGKFSAPLENNIVTLTRIAGSYTFLLGSSPIGVLSILKWYRERRNLLLLTPLVILAVSSLFIISEIQNSKWIFFHHFGPLIPYLSIVIVSSLLLLTTLANSKGGFKRLAIVLTVVAILSVANYSNIQYLTSSLTGYYTSPDPANVLQRNVGLAVKDITDRQDAIWTSEGAIGFFADRVIAAPNSSSWPVRACYSEIFSYDFKIYRGEQSGYPNGCVTIQEFVEAWESQKIKVLVFIRGNGWIPYPDDLLWNGFRGQTGVKSYVETNYRLHSTFTGIGSAGQYVYEVWVRNP
jgi:4-amino-4-deoxy-L-arabinose transferase-like glycosyltransferase